VTSNGPLRGAKATLYEGGVRVPAVAAWDGHIPAGSVVNAPLHAVDRFPTLLGLAGAGLDQSLPLDGRDAWPAIAHGAASPHEAILLNAAPRAGAIRVGDWKLIVRSAAADARNDVDEDGTTPNRDAATSAALYNLSDDPYEKHDLATANPERVAELRSRYEGLARRAVPPKSAPKAPDFRSPRVWGEAD
jgi:arylsulfatase A-like enzyme